MSFKDKVEQVATEAALATSTPTTTYRSYQLDNQTFVGGTITSIADDFITVTVQLANGTFTTALMGFQQRVVGEVVSAIGGILS